MAWYTLPAPGAKVKHGPDKGMEIGPCVNSCQHKDCARMREELKKPCEICGETI